MKIIHAGKTASEGIAAAKIYLYPESELSPEEKMIAEEAIAQETAVFEKARDAVIQELKDLAKENEFFRAHLKIAEDFTLREGVFYRIEVKKKNAQMAVAETIEEYAKVFSSMDDAYMREREADIRDIGRRFMLALKDNESFGLEEIQEEVIVVARELYPSDMAGLDPKYVKGIVMENGGACSHVSILAQSMGIPVLTGVKGILEQAEQSSFICMDAGGSVVILEPDASVRREYLEKTAAGRAEKKEPENLPEKLPEKLTEKLPEELQKKLPEKAMVTESGKRIFLCANAGNLMDIRRAVQMNIDGIGLFRSEFFYMESDHFPTEEEQFRIYKEAALLCPQELTIRTLDIGGDKELPYFRLEKEKNPFLGWRGIRISLDRKDIFKEQIRAILRAGVYGHVRIMFPMLVSVGEFKAALAVVDECKKELAKEKIPYDENIMTGVMLETPAGILLAEEFAEEADFFSIGTNDLTQYLLAADRTNDKVSGKYDYFHPAVLRAIKMAIQEGHKAGIRVGMCGGMAGDVKAVPLLLEMGLDEFSVPAGRIDDVRAQILDFISHTFEQE